MFECIVACLDNYFKSFWTDELTVKKAPVEAYNLWNFCDKPRSGLVNKL